MHTYKNETKDKKAEHIASPQGPWSSSSQNFPQILLSSFLYQTYTHECLEKHQLLIICWNLKNHSGKVCFPQHLQVAST
jgi:hypothetical protein